MTNATDTIKPELLARTLADALSDGDRAALYAERLREQPLAVILRAYKEAKTFPVERTRKPRVALFFYLLRKYADERD